MRIIFCQIIGSHAPSSVSVNFQYGIEQNRIQTHVNEIY